MTPDTLLLSARAALLAEKLGEIMGSIGYVDLVVELNAAKHEAAEIAAQLREISAPGPVSNGAKPEPPWTTFQWPRV